MWLIFCVKAVIGWLKGSRGPGYGEQPWPGSRPVTFNARALTFEGTQGHKLTFGFSYFREMEELKNRRNIFLT